MSEIDQDKFGSVKVTGLKKNLQIAFENSFEKLRHLDIAEVSSRAGVSSTSVSFAGEEIIISYLNRPVTIDIARKTITSDPAQWEEIGGVPKPSENLFIIHYLVNASGKKQTSSLVPFRNMDGGSTYNSVFQERAINRLVRAFRTHEEYLLDACTKIGGVRIDIGNVAMKLNVLPNVDIALILWKGDEEILSSGNILFDSAITDYLPSEDCVVLAENIVTRVISIYKNLSVGKNNQDVKVARRVHSSLYNKNESAE